MKIIVEILLAFSMIPINIFIGKTKYLVDKNKEIELNTRLYTAYYINELIMFFIIFIEILV